MKEAGYDFETVKRIQEDNHVGHTPLVELKQMTTYARKFAKNTPF